MKKQVWMALAVASMVGAAQAQDAAAPAAPAAGAGTVVFGFEDDAWKAGKFGAENGSITIAATNATEGTKALALTFDRTGKAEGARPTVRINKVTAFTGAKKVLLDYTFAGTVDPKTKIRGDIRDVSGASASTEEIMTEGKSTLEIDLVAIDAANVNTMKICLDNCKSGKGVLYIDNIRIVK